MEFLGYTLLLRVCEDLRPHGLRFRIERRIKGSEGSIKAPIHHVELHPFCGEAATVPSETCSTHFMLPAKLGTRPGLSAQKLAFPRVDQARPARVSGFGVKS